MAGPVPRDVRNIGHRLDQHQLESTANFSALQGEMSKISGMMTTMASSLARLTMDDWQEIVALLLWRKVGAFLPHHPFHTIPYRRSSKPPFCTTLTLTTIPFL